MPLKNQHDDDFMDEHEEEELSHKPQVSVGGGPSHLMNMIILMVCGVGILYALSSVFGGK